MSEVETYDEALPFPGHIGRTWQDSRPAFPTPRKSVDGAPNVITILLDDLGFGAISCFGGLVDTPNIDRLAEGGLRFTNFHTAPVCSPTRAALLSGRNPHSVGMGATTNTVLGYPGYNGRHPEDASGMAAILGANGYRSLCAGKWHNTPGNETGPGGPFDRWPTGRIFGFDQFYGFNAGETDQWYPALFQDTWPIDPPALPSEGYHLSDDLVDQCIRFIARQGAESAGEPWHIYLSFGAMHAPHHVAREWADRYRGAFDDGWDVYREVVLQRQRELGVISPACVLSPMLEEIPPWESLGDDRKRVFARMAEVFAGFLSHTDHAIGRLYDYLETAGAASKTLTFMIGGDNGSSAEGGPEGLYNEMSFFSGSPEPFEYKLENIDNLGLPGSYNHYPAGWAMAMNTPYRLCKQYTHFGGTRVPLVVHWPGHIADRGGIRDQFHFVTDVVPSVLESAGIEMPKQLRGIEQRPLDGVSMNYLFEDGDAPSRRKVQYFECFGSRAIVDGDWKAVTQGGKLPWEGRPRNGSIDDQVWELYDLRNDPAESRNLVAVEGDVPPRPEHRARLSRLVELWWAEAGRNMVLPLDDRTASRMAAFPATRGHGATGEFVFVPPVVRIPERSAPDTKNRSWSLSAEIEVGERLASGPVCVLGGETGGWSLYLDDAGRAAFCYNFSGYELTTVRSEDALSPGRHTLRYDFVKTGDGHGSGGIMKLSVDENVCAEKRLRRTMAFKYSIGETFNVGWDKGSPVCPEYSPNAKFSGSIDVVRIRLGNDKYVEPSREAIEAVRAEFQEQ